MKKPIILLSLMLSAGLHAQISFEKLESKGKDDPMDISYLVEPEMVRGTPLGFNEWRKGRVVVTSGDTSDYFLINYHTLGDVVYFKNEQTEDLYMTDETSIQALLLTNPDTGNVDRFERILWQNFEEYPKDPRICQILVWKPDFELIRYFDKELEKPEETSNDKFDRRPVLEAYNPKVRYFWRSSDAGLFEEVDFNKNWLREVLSKDQQDKMKDYQKANKIKWNDDDEVVAMLNEIL